MLLPFITPVDIGLVVVFISTLVGSIWFCLNNYRSESENS